MRDPDVELALAAAASRSFPAPPIPPPELTSSGKPLTKRQKKEVCHFSKAFTYIGIQLICLYSLNMSHPVPTGLTSQLHLKQTFLGCTVKWRHFDCETN